MTSDTHPRVSRRSVTKGVAWAVPAVAIASAAPKIAASPIVTVTQAGTACKQPGGSCAPYIKGYLQPLQICNNSTQSITVTIIQPATLLFNGVLEAFTPYPTTFTLATKGCQRVVLNISHSNSENSTISGTIQWSWVATDGQHGTGSTTINTTATNPCVNCTV